MDTVLCCFVPCHCTSFCHAKTPAMLLHKRERFFICPESVRQLPIVRTARVCMRDHTIRIIPNCRWSLLTVLSELFHILKELLEELFSSFCEDGVAFPHKAAGSLHFRHERNKAYFDMPVKHKQIFDISICNLNERVVSYTQQRK